MAILLVDANAGLFNLLGKAVHALNTLNTSRLTTVPDEVQDVLTQFSLNTGATLGLQQAIAGLPSANSAWQEGGAILTSTIAQAMRDLIIEFANDDADQPKRDFDTALEYLLDDIITQDFYVDPNVIGASLAADADNSDTDLAIAFSTKRGDGRTVENALAEVITATVESASSPLTPTVRFVGKRAAADQLSQEWPIGSGCDTSVTATDAAASLIDNGDFEDVSANLANHPDKWIASEGIAGTDYLLTEPEEQTVIIAGGPASGQYFLAWENPEGANRVTEALVFNASGSAVQAALRAIPGLELVTVETTGSTPNFTHTVTFTGVAGNVNQLTSISQLNAGTISHNTTQAGSANAFKGVGLEIVGDGATATDLYLPIGTLDPETVYFVHYRHKKTGTPAGGTVRLAIVDGIGGAVTVDAQGGGNSVEYDLTADLTTGFTSGYFSFRLKKTQTQPVYLNILQTVEISAGTSYAIDEIAMASGTELYQGGLFVSAFSGSVPPIVGDKYLLTVTNDRAGAWQSAFQRLFDLSGKGLLIQSAGSTNIPDALIA